MQRIGEKIFSISILGFFTVLLYMSIQLSPTSRRMPIFIGVIGFIVTLAIVVIEFRRSGNDSSEIAVSEEKELGGESIVKSFRQRLEDNKEIGFFVWLIIFFVLIYVMGSIIGIPAYLFLVTRYFFKERWHVSVLLAAGSLTVYYLLFLKLLRMSAYEGLLWNLLRF